MKDVIVEYFTDRTRLTVQLSDTPGDVEVHVLPLAYGPCVYTVPGKSGAFYLGFLTALYVIKDGKLEFVR